MSSRSPQHIATREQAASQSYLIRGRVLCWFSRGIASAVAAKKAIELYSDFGPVEVCVNELDASEHPDNRRFQRDVEAWLGQPIVPVNSTKFADIWDVFRREKFIRSPNGAPCTRALKVIPGREYTDRWDWSVYGFTADESDRIDRFEANNPELRCLWPLRDLGITKADCKRIIREAGIEIPAMYKLGYKNNNCIGCVKGGVGYWNKIRRDFPEAFERMNAVSREIGFPFLKLKGVPVYLDEIPPDAGRYEAEPDIECGPVCVQPSESVETEEQP